MMGSYSPRYHQPPCAGQVLQQFLGLELVGTGQAGSGFGGLEGERDGRREFLEPGAVACEGDAGGGAVLLAHGVGDVQGDDLVGVQAAAEDEETERAGTLRQKAVERSRAET